MRLIVTMNFLTFITILLILSCSSDAGTTEHKCKVSDNGSYGDDVSDTLSFETITYYYQIEYDNSKGNFDEILNELEHGISNYVLKETSLFPQCSSKRFLSASPPRRNLGMKSSALWSKPIDKVASDISCNKDTVSNIDFDCVIMEGVLSLFYHEVEHSTDTFKSYEREVRDAIEDGIKNERLQKVNPEIINLRYIKQSDYINVAQATGSGLKISKEADGSGLEVSIRGDAAVIFFSMCGTLVVLILGGKLAKHHGRRRGGMQSVGMNKSSIETGSSDSSWWGGAGLDQINDNDTVNTERSRDAMIL